MNPDTKIIKHKEKYERDREKESMLLKKKKNL